MNNHGGNRGMGRSASDNSPRLDKKTRKHVIGRLLGYMMKHWPFVILALVMTLLSNQLALLGPNYLGDAVDAIAAEGGVKMDVVMSNFYKIGKTSE